ncbi:MAG: PAS domain S-box protein [Actinobacteria bacterium]|nr:MAG: PAS domain S-box protein [Actinomycetota bacterium]
MRYAITAAGLAGAYVAAAKLGIELPVAQGVITPVWAPTGIALAGLLLLGRNLWPAVAVGAFVANATSGASIGEAAGISVGNTLEAVVGATLLLRADIRPALDRVRDVFALAVLGALASPVLAASNGVGVLSLSGKLHHAGTSWLLWWIGDGMGALIVTPLLLVASTRPWREFPRPAQRLEAVVVLAAVGGVSATIFFAGGWRYPHVIFPLLVWATLRFRQPGAVAGSFLVTAIAVAGAIHGSLPLGEHTTTQLVEIVEGLLAAVVVSLFLLGAVLSERVRAVEGLAEAQRVAHLGSWEWDIPHDRITWSDELYRLYGLQPGASRLTYESYLERIHPEDLALVRETVDRAYAERAPFEMEHRVVLPGGGLRWLHGRGRVVTDDSGAPVRMVGTSQDITDRKHVEELRESILSAVSHELRTPLTSIVGFSLTLQQYGSRVSSERRREIVDHLTREARRLERLLSDLLDLDRLRLGSVGASFRRTDLGRLVAGVVADYGSDAHPVELELEAVEANIDAPKVERIVDNLLANAFRHTPAGAEVRVRVASGDGGAVISVDDRGPGIGPDEREAIFEIFRRGSAGIASGRGTGVGLALVAQFAALHGGRAWVEDNPGGGASFRVFLPSNSG